MRFMQFDQNLFKTSLLQSVLYAKQGIWLQLNYKFHNCAEVRKFIDFCVIHKTASIILFFLSINQSINQPTNQFNQPIKYSFIPEKYLFWHRRRSWLSISCVCRVKTTSTRKLAWVTMPRMADRIRNLTLTVTNILMIVSVGIGGYIEDVFSVNVQDH